MITVITDLETPSVSGTSDKPEVVRKAVSRRKREERRPTQAVTADDIPAPPPKEAEKKAEEAPPKQLVPPTLVVPTLPNGPTAPLGDDKKPRHVPVTVSISDSGAVVWDSTKKSPENETPSPVSNDNASDKPEIVRKKVARRKRDERRSTQHVSKDDLPAAPEKQQPEQQPAPETSANGNKEKEDHLAKVFLHFIQHCSYCITFTRLVLVGNIIIVTTIVNHNKEKPLFGF